MGSVEIPGLKMTASASSGTLELAHYNASATGTKKLSTGYLDQNDHFHDLGLRTDSGHETEAKLVNNDHVLYVTITVTVAFDTDIFTDGVYTDSLGNQWTQAQVLSALSSKNYYVTASIPEGSRARIFASSGTAAENDPTTSVNSAQLATPASMSAGYTDATFTFCAYFYGGTDSQDDNATAIGNALINLTLTAGNVPA